MAVAKSGVDDLLFERKHWVKLLNFMYQLHLASNDGRKVATTKKDACAERNVARKRPPVSAEVSKRFPYEPSADLRPIAPLPKTPVK
jgi:hypothetical protein